MEGPERMGAGPVSTGIDGAQLELFVEHEIFDPAEVSADELAINGVRRAHALDRRPDRLHTSGHFGARGDRLEVVCRRRTDRGN